MSTTDDFTKEVQTEFALMNDKCILQEKHYALAVKHAFEKYRQILSSEEDNETLLSDNYSSKWLKDYAFACALDMHAAHTRLLERSKSLGNRAKEEKATLESSLKNSSGVGGAIG